jgi:hypothetical protein
MKDANTFVSMGWSIGADDSTWLVDAAVNDGYPSLRPLSTIVVPTTVGPVKIGTLRFRSKSARLSTSAKIALVAAASEIKARGYSKVTVRVYTTSRRTGLAMLRARKIARFLQAQGVTVTIRRQGATVRSKRLNNSAAIFGISS